MTGGIILKVSAVICEYNPFHNGHKYQIEKIKEKSDAVAAVMSGPFVQRGEPAAADKFVRARAAVENGADLVVELPVLYAVSTAQSFAAGAVELIEKMNAVDTLAFGIECESLEMLGRAAEYLINEPCEVSEKIKKYTNDGMAYPNARAKAFDGIISAEILEKPNNILALEYIRALKLMKSKIEPMAIIRNKELASAHKIREKLFLGKSAAEDMPEYDFETADPKALDNFIIGLLRVMEKERLCKIRGVSEGLENRIKRAALNNTALEDMLQEIKTKRYPMSRIKRTVIAAALGIEKDFNPDIKYLRVLAIGEKGADILRKIKQSSKLEIITKAADYKSDDKLFELDIKANDIYSMCINKKGGLDYITSPYVI